MKNLVIYREDSPNVIKKIKYYKNLGVNAILVNQLGDINDEKIAEIIILNEALQKNDLLMIIKVDVVEICQILLDYKTNFDWANPKVRNSLYQFVNYLSKYGIRGFFFTGLTEIIEKVSNPRDFLAYMRELDKNVKHKVDMVTIAELNNISIDMAKSLKPIFDYIAIKNKPLDNLFDIKTSLLDLYQNNPAHIILDSNNALKNFTNSKNYPFKSHSLVAGLTFLLAGAPLIHDFEELGIFNFDASKNDVNMLDNSNMTLNFYMQMLAARAQYKVINEGSFRLLFEKDSDILAYMKVNENEKLIVFANFSQSEILVDIRFHFIDLYDYEYLLGNYGRRRIVKNLLLRPFELVSFIKE